MKGDIKAVGLYYMPRDSVEEKQHIQDAEIIFNSVEVGLWSYNPLKIR